ncbi:hypothetical protein GCM10027590_26250 [Nocardiopsis nanhaiensis]
MNQSVLYLAIAMSGLIGAAGIELLGSRYVSLLAAVLALVALAVSYFAQRLIRQADERTPGT